MTKRMAKRDFISLLDCEPEELKHLIASARRWRTRYENRFSDAAPYEPMRGKTAGLILELSSTRTRVAFEAGMQQMGGHTIVLKSGETQLGRGEPIRDAARVLSEMLDVIIIRTLKHETVLELAHWASVPVINAMTDKFHPCQLLADVQTFEEQRGPIEGKTVAFIGDGYNMCHSFINAARQFNFNLRIATPQGYTPDPEILASTNRASLVKDAQAAVDGADLVVTDVWSSMGHEEEQQQRIQAFAPFQVTEDLLESANKEAIFMHCLPAHRGEEVNETILDDPRSVVWQEAGNRMHSQKALLEFLVIESRQTAA